MLYHLSYRKAYMQDDMKMTSKIFWRQSDSFRKTVIINLKRAVLMNSAQSNLIRIFYDGRKFWSQCVNVLDTTWGRIYFLTCENFGLCAMVLTLSDPNSAAASASIYSAGCGTLWILESILIGRISLMRSAGDVIRSVHPFLTELETVFECLYL